MAGYNPTEYFKSKPKSYDGAVSVSYDPSIITKRKKVDSKVVKDFEEQSKSVVSSMSGTTATKSNKLSNLSSKSSESKSNRLFKLQNAIQTKRVKTAEEAEELIGVSLKTIVSYLKELGYSLDSQKNIIK